MSRRSRALKIAAAPVAAGGVLLTLGVLDVINGALATATGALVLLAVVGRLAFIALGKRER